MERGRGRGRGFGRGGRGGDRGGARGRGRGGFRGDRSDRPQRPLNPTKLHVTNLPEECTVQQLEALFDQFGKVVECDIVRDFAFVHYRNAEDADKAVESLNNHDWNGTNLVVRHSTSGLRQKPGASMGDCFKCGGRGHNSTLCPTQAEADPYAEAEAPTPAYPPARHAPYPSPYRRDPYMRDPYLDPYARMVRDPYLRRAVPPVDPYYRERLRADPYADPYLRQSYLADPYGRLARDPYARPPPEFYERGRGRGMKVVGRGGEENGVQLLESEIPQIADHSALEAPQAHPVRPANDPYFFSDEYDKSSFQIA